MIRIDRRTIGLFCCSALTALAQPAAARDERPSIADRFQIGSDALELCSAQYDSRDAAATGLFDRAYAIVCRDTPVPVGRAYAVRVPGEAEARIAAARAERMQCAAAPEPIAVAELSAATTLACTAASGIDHRVYQLRRGRTLYVVEGLSGYDPVLRMALRSLVLDRPVEGEIQVATASSDADRGAFARAIASTLDPEAARTAGYRSNNAGQFVEAAAYFENLLGQSLGGLSADEVRLNRALQLSNLGEFIEAERLFAALPAGSGDPVQDRLRRNYLALHLLNRGDTDAALGEIERSLASAPAEPVTGPTIDPVTAARLNSGNALAPTTQPSLTPAERARILDAQAAQIRGGLLRIKGRPAEAEAALAEAQATLAAVRQGQVASVAWLRARVLSDRAALAESAGDRARAEALLREAVRITVTEYPDTSTDLLARSRLAAFLARNGQAEAALTLYRAVVRDAVDTGETVSLRNDLAPYFGLLLDAGATQPEALDDFFFASQTLTRLGVARTQGELARLLSSGSDQAAGLFRASAQTAREVARQRRELARLQGTGELDAGAAAQAAVLRTAIADLEVQQAAAQSRLNQFARYQVASAQPLPLAELQQALRPGEAYYKLFFVEGQGFGALVTAKGARIVRLAASERAVEQSVVKLRESVRKEVDGQTYVLPFDLETAHQLYGLLFGQFAADMQGVRHLIVEPDGPLLQLPLNLLVTDGADVERYRQRSTDPKADLYDFTGVAWLGRDVTISTALSARTLSVMRASDPAVAPRPYLGFGDNAPPPPSVAQFRTSGDAVCVLPVEAWRDPISPTELEVARGAVGTGEVTTGAAFNDVSIRTRDDLGSYRILHFATHGLVTPANAGCPAQPALLTSWGSEGSDGLLTFQEVFGLSINADVVILSACDTASQATLEATRAAGERTGGGYALDGLVRAFIGAGGRLVVASHWPVPERPIAATTLLIGGMFRAPAGTAIADALRTAQVALMDQPSSSHPYYWSAFALIGDGSRPLLTGGVQAVAAAP